MKRYSTILTIAGSDSSGGAGIQADIKTFAALGCYGVSVITAITAQNTMGVRGTHLLPPRVVQQQLEAVLSDTPIAVAKIGMLGTANITKVVAHFLQKYHRPTLVLDPILKATSGKILLEKKALSVLRRELLPLTTILTPNIPEAEELTQHRIRTYDDMENVASLLLEMGPTAVLIKGGHLKGRNLRDYLVLRTNTPFSYEKYWLTKTRIVTKNTHGTGCTLSAAIAAYLAKGQSIVQAVENAKEYLTNALAGGARYDFGKGHGPLHHFYKYWQ